MTDLTLDAPAAEELRFFGPFEAIRTLELPETSEGGLYDGFYAGFYDFLTWQDQYDLPTYLERARTHGSPLLELACGSGRLAVPLARAGFAVTAVDLERDMLRVLSRRLAGEAPEVRGRVTALRADMTTIALGRRFPLVVLGALSLCLLRTPDARRALFERVAEHLAPGGRFLFDYLDGSEEALRADDERVLTVPASAGDRKRFTLIGQRYYPEEGVQVVNFFSEVVDADGRTRRHLASTTKWVVDAELVRRELAGAGLEIESVEPIATLPGGRTIRLVSAQSAAR
jgi:SAM-dependent methyltransferase